MRQVTKRLYQAFGSVNPHPLCIVSIAAVRHVPEPYFTALVDDILETAKQTEMYFGQRKNL